MTVISQWDEEYNWAAHALCAQERVDLFVRGAAQNKAKLICRSCPVQVQCLAEALNNGVEWGVWGGMTERERRALLRRQPHITEWKSVLKPAD